MNLNLTHKQFLQTINSSFSVLFFSEQNGDYRALHKLTHSFPTRRSSDLPSSTGPTCTPIMFRPASGLCGMMKTRGGWISEEHTSELQSRELISYAVFC